MPRNETRIVVRHAPSPRLTSILSPGALVFVADVVCAFRTRLSALLTRRARLERRPRRAPRRRLPESADVRSSRWTCLAVPPILADRRVEIVGPVDRASVFAALDSAADAFVADLDDATSPTWSNILDGHANLRDAAKGTLSVDVAGSRLDLRRSAPPIFLRPRGVGVHEDHVLLDGQPVPAALFDVALYAFHVARDLAARGAGPFFSLTKVDGQFEARFWRDLFSYLEGALALPRGTIKAVVRVDTPRAALEMHEMLWELREHSAGLACGRWEYVQSVLRERADDPTAVMPGRHVVTIDRAPLAACAVSLVRACHERGVPAIGPISTDTPFPSNGDRAAEAIVKVCAASSRHARAGFDGTRVAHHAVVGAARESFDAVASDRKRTDVVPPSIHVEAADLVSVPGEAPTEAAVIENVRVALLHLDAWLTGRGRVVMRQSAEDAGAAGLARAQLWHWLHHRVRLDDGALLTPERFETLIASEAALLGVPRRVSVLLERLCLAERLEPVEASEVPLPRRVPIELPVVRRRALEERAAS